MVKLFLSMMLPNLVTFVVASITMSIETTFSYNALVVDFLYVAFNYLWTFEGSIINNRKKNGD